MKKFNITLYDFELDVLDRACRYGMIATSKNEEKDGTAEKTRKILTKVQKQIECKKRK